jgi:hypothetical protein
MVSSANGRADGRAAEQRIGPAGHLHGQHQRRHAEEGPVERRFHLRAERALRPRAGGGDDHRLVRAEQEQRREIDGVRHRHRRAAARERKADLQRGRQRRASEKDQEQDEIGNRMGRKKGENQRACGQDGPDEEPRR